MSFIGIITSNKNEETLKKGIAQALKEQNIKQNIIIINEENLENMKNIKFNSIIINKENIIVEQRKVLLQQILKNTKYLIINSDIYKKLDIAYNLNIAIITYGYNLKATITASSINEERILLCVQRNIITNNKNNVEPKEIYVKILYNDIYTTMASNATKLIFS